MLRATFAIILLVGAFLTFSWVAGYRFHPDALMEKFESHPIGEYIKVDLVQGTSFIGELVKQSEAGITVKIAEGRIDFSANEIKKTTSLSREAVNSLEYEQLFIQKKKNPIITFREEDNLLNQLKDINVSVQIPVTNGNIQTGKLTNSEILQQKMEERQETVIAQQKKMLEQIEAVERGD